MGKTISHSNYCDYFASKCPRCKGLKRVLRDGEWTSCVCQHIATVKWRFEQIKLEPPELKYHNWSDFNGIVRKRSPEGRMEQTGFIKGMDASTAAVVAESARSKAMLYCFDTDDCEAVKDRSTRKKHSIIHNRSLSGDNVVIAGNSQSGRSLLAALILKEVVRASLDSGKLYTFGWINGVRLIQAALWDSNKTIDHALIDEWSELDFLFIDNFHLRHSKSVCLDDLFFARRCEQRPTIITCSNQFLDGCRDVPLREFNSGRIRQMLGDEALDMMLNPSNVEIKLYVEGEHRNG